MRWFFVTLVVLLGCQATIDYPDPSNAAERVVFPICEAEGIPCILAEPGLDPNGVFKSWQYGGLRAGVVVIAPLACSKDPVLCEFVTWHEVGHLRRGKDQSAADCYAAAFASDVAIARAHDLFRQAEQMERASKLGKCWK